MKPKVLFGVLDWGLGHATRSLPIIKYLIDNGFEVHIASNGDSLTFLKHEFPLLQFYSLPSYNVKYPFKSILLNISLSSLSIMSAMIKEYFYIQKLNNVIKPDLIISDNRYGFRVKSVKSIIITHQLNLQLSNPFLSKIGSFFVKKLIDKFDEIWIPDFKNNLLAGKLSECNSKIPCEYLGPLSRFEKKENDIVYKVAVIISGPEPQRTKFEKIILQQFQNYNEKAVIVLGNIKENETYFLNENVVVKSHVFSKELNDIINKSEVVISRSGYSSIMDFVVLQKKALLIPTPGQSEQEYLAEYLKSKGVFYSVEQKKLNIKNQLPKLNDLKEIRNRKSSDFIDMESLFKRIFADHFG